MRYKKQSVKTRRDLEVKKSECVICLEHISIDGEPVVKLHESLFNETVVKTCSCACDVHASCAIKWVNMTRKCPICRTWCVIDLTTGAHVVIFNPYVPPVRTNWCNQFAWKCLQVFLFVALFIHSHSIIYVLIIYGAVVLNNGQHNLQ
jgi:hypothetical protein